MSIIPGGVDADQQPPMTIPLRHFVVGLGYLFLGVVAGTATEFVPGFGRLAHVHLLLVGWVCVTIMGAMTQFVPVWSGVTLHSRRLASLQLLLVTVGLTGFASGLLTLELSWLVPAGALMLAGFWVFVYNISRTLLTVDSYDVTERHFLLAISFFLLLTSLGFLLAANFTYPVLSAVSLTHTNVLGAHATVAVFGAVMTTVYGALYQLGTMFTQTELHGVDHYLQSVEEIGHPAGVVLLAGGRLTDTVIVAQVGGLLILLGAIVVGIILARKLVEMQVEWTPMHSRYAVLAPALMLWALLSAPAWLSEPMARDHLLGADGTLYVLLLGVIGFVILGTLYHIIPFIIWVHRYSDLLGFEEVPMIDDLYDDRLAALDFTLVLGGSGLLVGSEQLGIESMTTVGGILLVLGIAVFASNMFLVIHRHSPHTFDQLLLGSLSPRRDFPETGQSDSQ